MYKHSIIAILACFGMMTASSQTLFRYGKYSADAQDFLKTYNKNNTKPVTKANKAKSISDYLDLYIKSKLKVREAYDRGYDTLRQINSEVDNLRSQVAENYLTDPALGQQLFKEAFQRSQKDIHTAHIFISFRNELGGVDTIAANTRKEAILERLRKGEDFLTVARQNSDDPSAKTNNGDLGYITVFTLPYPFENTIYKTTPGKYSITQSKSGYHIFKNLGERKAVGRIKAQQILLAIPPGSDETAKNKISKLADSLYKRIIAGDNFSKLATAYSNDYISAASGGMMPDIGTGQYDIQFENALWTLPKDGAVSKPFLTAHGWHIVKRVSLKPVITDPANKANQTELQDKVKADARWKSSRDFIYDRIEKSGNYTKHNYSEIAFWAYTDSVFLMKPLGLGRNVNAQTPLFTIGDSTYTIQGWIFYSNSNRYNPDGTGAKPWPLVWDEYVKSSMYNYYRDHLEDFSPEFHSQMTEFRDGNLFFEIMQQEIWNKAQSDSAALLALYNQNQKNYTWKKSTDAVFFFCSDSAIAKTAYDQVKKDPANWRRISEMYSEKIITDSSRYEWSQVPGLGKATPKPGMILPPLVNSSDNTATFAYIINVYPQPTQRSFIEARGLVINDYQVILEKRFDEALRKKYPVVIDQKVLESISK
ncbi:MAG: peptidylprolyl isomerase [Chitinophagaceae bacterium]